MSKWVLKSGQPVRVLDGEAKELVAKGNGARYLSKDEARRMLAKNADQAGAKP